MTTNQYFIYGINLPYEWYVNWEKNHTCSFEDIYKNFITENIYVDDYSTNENLNCLFNGRDGEFLIIGRILEKVNDDKPIEIPMLNDFEIQYIKELVKKHFNVDGEFHYYYVVKFN